MMTGFHNLWRGHYTNHLLTFQSVLDLGVGLGAEGVMWHLALDQSASSQRGISAINTCL